MPFSWILLDHRNTKRTSEPRVAWIHSAFPCKKPSKSLHAHYFIVTVGRGFREMDITTSQTQETNSLQILKNKAYNILKISDWFPRCAHFHSIPTHNHSFPKNLFPSFDIYFNDILLSSFAGWLFNYKNMHGMKKDFFLPNGTTCPLWTSWSSVLGMAGV